MDTTDSSKPSGSSEKKSVQPLPDNPWGLLAMAVKALGDHAPMVLIAAGVVAAFIMLQRERDDADRRVESKTREAHERLTETYEKIAAASTGQVDGLSKVINLSQTLTGTIADQVNEVQKMNSAADKLRKEADDLRDEMKQLSQERDSYKQVGDETRAWGNLFLLSLLAGEIASAPTKKDAQEIFAQIEKVEVTLKGDAGTSNSAVDIKDATKQLGDAIAQWNDASVAAAPERPPGDEGAAKLISPETSNGQANVQQACLALARASRQSFDEAPKPLQDLIAGVRRVLYDQAVSVAYRLAKTTRWSEAASDRREFLSLYWGQLVFVESREVEVIMVHYRRALDEWERQDKQGSVSAELNNERRKLADELRLACGTPGYKVNLPVNVDKERGT